MATLGNATGAGATPWPQGYEQVAGPYPATENGTIDSVKLKVQGNANGDLTFRAVVYLDNAGEPDAKVATSAETTVLSAQAAGEVTLSVSAGSLVSGSSYWIGFETGVGSGGGGTTAGFFAAAGTSKYRTIATYPTAPDPFGASTTFTDKLWAYIVYTPAGGSPPVNTVAPAVTGTATVGQTLSCTTGTWTDGTPVFTYQWQRDVAGNGSFSNIAAATANTYVLVDADDGNKVRCVVTDTDENGATSANSNATALIVEPIPTNSVAPVASGTAQVGATVSATTGTWTHQGGSVATYAYQWQDSANGSTGWANISGKTSSAYLVEAGELTKFLRCNVTAHNSGGDAAAATPTNVLGAVIAAAAGGPIHVIERRRRL